MEEPLAYPPMFAALVLVALGKALVTQTLESQWESIAKSVWSDV
jgi:hypothetical protein